MVIVMEWEVLMEVLAIVNLQDVFCKFIEEMGYYSWWDYCIRGFSCNWGWCIDYYYLIF